MPTLGQRLVQIRTERNLLQKNIAKDNEISLRMYRYYESDEKEPTTGVIIKLANYFQCSSDYLLGLSNTPDKRD